MLYENTGFNKGISTGPEIRTNNLHRETFTLKNNSKISPLLFFIQKKQAGAELCQAQQSLS